ncbi:cell adhesion molecule-related/down-regulated by oncogenes-like [Hemiscyllium ocellatum]|uniref:cell adhesion molecule-related/down-regulated by oncogenes-like n=1 Tax=Hemiscyllium ocellatum TaxID=170820 RepID=UPI002966D76D|nr:cell adhesion molecule-related/down-regulated by oncogenes-like [Hemiscyllium ocellatum]
MCWEQTDTASLVRDYVQHGLVGSKAAAGGISAKVNPDLKQITVQRGSTAIMLCPFSYQINYSNVIAYWWREGDKTFLQEDRRKFFHIVKGAAYLKLLNVTVQDAGTYICAVKSEQRTIGKGTAVQLTVYASPAPLKIVFVLSEDHFAASLRLQCRTSYFYPKAFNLTWHKNGRNILTGFRNEQQAKTGDLYEVISSLELQEAVQSDFASKISVPMVVGCALRALAILILTVMIGKGFLFFKSKDANETPFSVTQVPTCLTEVEGMNVSMYCSIPLFRHNPAVDVYWQKSDQGKTLDLTADQTTIMLPFKQGSSELQLLNLHFQDSGIYYCSIRVSGRKIFNRNGTRLIVHVPPTPVKIVQLPAPTLTLHCTTAPFFPEEIYVIWYKNDILITSGINATKVWKEGSLFKVASVLNHLESGSVYMCQISHVALQLPACISYKIQGNGNNNFPYVLVSGCAVGGLIILFPVVAILVKQRTSGKPEGTQITEDIPEQLETQTKQSADVKLIYTSVEFTNPQKSEKNNQQKMEKEYAKIKINKPHRESQLV